MTPPRPRWLRARVAAVRSCTAAILSFLPAACQDATAPAGPPYLAIVSTVYAVAGASAPDSLRFRIHDLGTALGNGKRVRAAAGDTVIVALRPAAYEVTVEGLPDRCVVANGAARAIVLTDEDNTGIIRYSVQCRGVVAVAVLADGPALDSSFVYRVRDGAGGEWPGLVGANDTASVDGAAAGPVEVRLGGLAPNCVVTSDGGLVQRADAPATGGLIVTFRVTCSDLAARPQLLELRGGHDKGASIFTFRVWDPDGDVEGYTWDLTDCEGRSILPDRRERIRRGLRSGRGALSDTLVVVGAFETGLAPEQVAGRCTEIRVFDARYNSSVILQHRIGSSGGAPPVVRFFDARLQGTSAVTSLLLASDPENDIVGHFVLVRLRDGVLGQRDGVPDLGSMDPAGYLSLDVPPIPTTGRIAWDDVLAVIAYVVDRRGNAVRVEDRAILP